ncbi:unnamed protein product, partial [Closterium sp. NIES-53]
AAGARTAGARTAGARTAGARTAGAETAGARTAGVSTGGRTAGTRTAGAETDAARTVGVRIAGARTAGSRTAGARTAGAEAAGAKMARARTAGAQLAGARKLQARAGWSARCPYVIRTGDRAGQTCGTVGHMQSRCFSCLSDTWQAEFGDASELPRWLELLRQGVDIFALDYDAILTAMYALTIGTEGDCSLCVLPDPGIEAAALGASESALPGTVSSEALHTFTPFHCSPVSGGSVWLTIRSSLPLVLYELGEYRCPPGCNGHHHHSWESACVDLHVYTDGPSPLHVHSSAWVDSLHTGYRASSGSCVWSGSTPLLVSPPDAPDSPEAPSPWSLLPATPCGMHSRLLVSRIPRYLPPLPPLPAPPSLPCVEGWQRAAPHSSSFPPTTAPLQTLHMDVKGQAVDVLIPSIQAVRLQLRERFHQDLPVLHLHSDRGGDFSSDL